MKNNNKKPIFLKKDIKVILLTMKFTILIFFTCIVQMYAVNSYSQETRLSLNTKEIALTELFKEIERNSQFLFNYIDSDVAGIKSKVCVKDGTIQDILTQAFRNTDLVYSIDNRHITVSKRKKSTNEESQIIPVKKVKITGIVTDINNEPLIGVSVTEKGTINATMTDMDGRYSLTVFDAAIVTFSYLGFNTVERKTGTHEVINITMEESKIMLEEVVVTALGIKKQEKTLGYSLQQVNSDVFETVKTDNFLNRLNGKVAGLTVNTRAGILEDPAITLRGVQPIYVVNGTPVEYYRSVSTDDIESITVLKGPQAAVLYGARGADGAILITTKTGSEADGKFDISINSSTMFTAGYITLPEQQTIYGTGDFGQYAYKDGTGNGLHDGLWTWGPKLDQRDPTTASGYWETPQYNSPIDPETGERIPTPFRSHKDDFKNFLQQGLITNNNISVSKKFDKGSMRISLNQMYRRGQTPNTDLKRFGLNVSGSYNITPKLQLNANILYSYLYSRNRHWSGYGNQHPYYNILVYMGANNDINDLKNYWEPGQEGYQQRNWNHVWFNNPWFVAHEYERPYSEPETIASASLKYDFTQDLNLLAKAATDSKHQNHEENKPYAWVGNDFGEYKVTSDRRVTVDLDAMLSYKKRFGDFDVDAMVGASLYEAKTNYMQSATVGGLQMPGLYNVSNSVSTPVTTTKIEREQMTALYGNLTWGYKNALYLTLTGRNDWSSALIKDNRSFFYPSVSFSGIVTELVKIPDLISFLKVRASWARVGRTMSIYQLQDYYSFSQYWGGSASFVPEDILIDKNIKPYFTNSLEVGADIRLFKDRLRFDFSYYNVLDQGTIQQVDINQSSGYSKYLTNGNDYKRTGYELLIGVKPVDTRDIKWNVNLTWSLYRNRLHKIYNDNYNYGNLKVGDRADAMYAKVWQRDPDGNFIVYEHNGRPIEDKYNRIVGYSKPDWEYGISTNFSYKNWRLAIDASGRVGGVIVSDLNARMIQGGTHPLTAVPERELDWTRVVSYIPSNAVIVTGGDINYDDHGNVLSDTRTYAPSSTPMFFKAWIGYLGQLNGPYTEGYNIFKGDFFKLRSVAITYDFTDMIRGNKYITGLELSLIGNNLWMWKKLKYEDPDASYKNFSYPTERMIGFNLKVSL